MTPDQPVRLSDSEPLQILVRAVAKPVAVKVKLGLNFDAAVGEEGSDKRASFENDLSQDLSDATGHPRECFCVRKLEAGSVIAALDIMPDSKDASRDPFAAAGDLAEQANDPASKLLKGKITSFLEAISFPTLKPGPMTPVTPRNYQWQNERMKVTGARSSPDATEGTGVLGQMPPKYQGSIHAADGKCDHCLIGRVPDRSASVLAIPSNASPHRQHQTAPTLPAGRTRSCDMSPISTKAFPITLQRSALQPQPRPLPSVSEAGHLGLSILKMAHGIIVSDKKTASPAAYSQKLRVGDVILRIDDVDVSDMDVSGVSERLHGAPYTTVKLEMRSKDSGEIYLCAIQRAEPLMQSPAGGKAQVLHDNSNRLEAFSYNLALDLFKSPAGSVQKPDPAKPLSSSLSTQQKQVTNRLRPERHLFLHC